MPLTIHHLQISQSERIPWLCEELSIPYTLTLHQRAPIFSPESIKSLHPLGQAPVIQDGSLTLAESGACAEYIVNKYGDGRLTLPPSHANYAEYLYWFHFANGNFQPQILRLLTLAHVDKDGEASVGPKERFDATLKLMDERLKASEWLAGEEFTVADVMVVFSLTTMRVFYGYDLTDYEGILGYLQRVVQREGYKRARAKADPNLELMVEGKPPVHFMERLEAKGYI